MSDRAANTGTGGAMGDAEFMALVRRAGHGLSEAEAADLRARFEAATEIVRPLREMDLGDGDLAVSFSPEAGREGGCP